MKYLHLLPLLLICSVASAQLTLERQVIAVAGDNNTSGSWNLSQTLGENAAQSMVSGTFFLNQGFQQAENNAPDSRQPQLPPVAYRVFPTPTEGPLNVELELPRAAQFRLELLDAAGRSLPQFATELSGTGTQHRQLDLSPLATGVYLLLIRDDAGRVRARVQVMRR